MSASCHSSPVFIVSFLHLDQRLSRQHSDLHKPFLRSILAHSATVLWYNVALIITIIKPINPSYFTIVCPHPGWLCLCYCCNVSCICYPMSLTHLCFIVFYCALLLCFYHCILRIGLLIYSAPQLQVFMVQTYLLTYTLDASFFTYLSYEFTLLTFQRRNYVDEGINFKVTEFVHCIISHNTKCMESVFWVTENVQWPIKW